MPQELRNLRVMIAQLGEYFLLTGFLDFEPRELLIFLRQLSFISVLYYLIKWSICFHLNLFIESLLGVSWTEKGMEFKVRTYSLCEANLGEKLKLNIDEEIKKKKRAFKSCLIVMEKKKKKA